MVPIFGGSLAGAWSGAEAQGGRETVAAAPDRCEVIECSNPYDSPEVPDVLVVEDEDLAGRVVADGQRIGVVAGRNAVERKGFREPGEFFLSAVVAEGKSHGKLPDQGARGRVAGKGSGQGPSVDPDGD